MCNPDQEQIIQKIVGEKIKELRRAGNMRAVELAAAAGLSQSQVSKIENGKATISIKTLGLICNVLDRPISYLFQSEEEIPRVMGTLTTVQGPERQAMIRFVKEVHKRSDGRMSLILLEASQLMTDGGCLEMLREGVVDIFIEGLKILHKYSPGMETLWLPYCFNSRAHMKAFVETDFFRNKLKAELLNAGVRILNKSWNWWRGLEWVLVSKQPIITPDQIMGLRVRAEEIPLSSRFWEAMGATPVVVPWADVTAALRQGHIDVLPTQKAHLYPMGFCRFARYVTRLGDVPPLLAVAVNETKYQALPPAIQKSLMDACEWTGDYFSDLVKGSEEENEAKNLAEFQAAYLSVDQGPWRAKVAEIRDRFLKEGVLDAEFWKAVQETRPTGKEASA